MTYCRYKDYQKVCRLIAFGDSNTDTGNAFAVSKKVLSLPNPPKRAVLKPIPGSWCKRASNGPLSVEVLANLLNVPLYNYSIGGAGTNEKNIFSWMNTFSDNGFLGQIDKYTKDLNICKSSTSDLYSIYIGGNTTFTYRPPTYNLDQATTLAIRDIEVGLANLIKIGAKNFIVFNLFDLGLTPYSIERGSTKEATEFTNVFNKKLKVMLNDLRSTHSTLKVIDFNLHALINTIVKNKNKYNITNINSQCHPSNPSNIPQRYYPCMASNCLFWDDYHVTLVINEIIGKQLYKTLLSNGLY